MVAVMKCNHDIQRKAFQWVCVKCDKVFTTIEMARYKLSILPTKEAKWIRAMTS